MSIFVPGQPILGFEAPISIAPVQQLRSVVLNENFYGRSPQTNSLDVVLSRVINAAVDMSAPGADRFITYKAPSGEQLTWYVNASGFTPINMLGIIAIGAAIDATSLQWGI
ncbi:hypothetical protein [Nitrospira sp. BLG_2]|uniref:hypothetical protein n=1 Tax=Nitrospira sp. BLG_2 TaxID=3397507 RepID=UPI003B994871